MKYVRAAFGLVPLPSRLLDGPEMNKPGPTITESTAAFNVDSPHI
jgi:hypothetical protein